MRFFVYEYASALGTHKDPSTRHWAAEGWAMLSALLDDFCRIPGSSVSTIVRDRWPGALPRPGNLHIERLDGEYSRLASEADYSLIVAPECDGILEERCGLVEQQGGKLLGSLSQAIRLTGDKFVLAQVLKDGRVPTPETKWLLSDDDASDLTFPLICKPRAGAGALATFLIHNKRELAGARQRANTEGWAGDLIVQPYVPGIPCSIAMIATRCSKLWFRPMRQLLTTAGRIAYGGGDTLLSLEQCRRAEQLANRAVTLVPGLRGFAGIDLVLGFAGDGSEDFAIEINPRITTSYVGLRMLTDQNLAQIIVDAGCGSPIAAKIHAEKTVAFNKYGEVRLHST